RPDDAPAALKFQARLVDDGTLTLRGAIADERMREAVDSFARSRFEVAQSRLRANPEAPGGWTLRLIAALESLGQLQTGHVEVTPELVRVAGVSGIADATDRIAAILAERLGPGARYELSIRYDRWLDAELGLPDGEECVASLNRIMSEAEIGFEPARASIAGDPEPTLAALSEVMVDCADYQIEAGGHTDSQGSEAFNADLSRSRAQAILAAMREAGIDTGNMTARGYGESQPIATNETEEGREANRRIEFRLLSPRPVRADALPEPVVLSGITGKAAEIKSPDPHNAGPNNTGSQIIGPQIKSSGNGFRAPGPLRPEIFDNGIAGPFGPQMHTTELLGPPLPPETGGGGASVRMLGASEDFETLDEREENIRVPVLTPDASTPRPVPRPVTSPDPDDTLPDENPDE
ncbi:MAG: OmpA family protein, partial [Paracoccus sp. (in: a-proteobacteria)]|nr:OmpA family protein [Paracoccus sp. (in: a-proteobacteria)]